MREALSSSDAVRATADRVERDVRRLAGDIGERHVFRPHALGRAAEHITASLSAAGYHVERQEYWARGVLVANLEAVLAGRTGARETVVVGAHYDSVPRCPGANDNGSGVAALLELARRAREFEPERELRFVAFVNEEPPFFRTELMGSRVYAERCRARSERIAAMVALETIGCFSSEPGSQRYPFPYNLLYPDRGDFVAVVGNLRSTLLARRVGRTLERSMSIPVRAAGVPGWLPGVGWSDHGSFWHYGYPAVMITDTAPFRYPHYHRPTDTPDRVDFESLGAVVDALVPVIAALAGAAP